MLMKEIVEHLILVTCQKVLVSNIVVYMKIQVVEGVQKELALLFNLQASARIIFPLSVKESTLNTFSHFSKNEIPQSP